jgi:hypothetical protein
MPRGADLLSSVTPHTTCAFPQCLTVGPAPPAHYSPAVAHAFYVQNAECLLLFPVPLPRPGFYSQSLAQFTSCVPAAACPGVDAVLVAAQYRSLLAGGPAAAPQLEAMLRQFFHVADANATRNASVGGGCAVRASTLHPHHLRVCTRYRCVRPPTPLGACAVQLGENGGNVTMGLEALRHVLLGYLNVSTMDCTLGESSTL